MPQETGSRRESIRYCQHWSLFPDRFHFASIGFLLPTLLTFWPPLFFASLSFRSTVGFLLPELSFCLGAHHINVSLIQLFSSPHHDWHCWCPIAMLGIFHTELSSQNLNLCKLIYANLAILSLITRKFCTRTDSIAVGACAIFSGDIPVTVLEPDVTEKHIFAKFGKLVYNNPWPWLV